MVRPRFRPAPANLAQQLVWLRTDAPYGAASIHSSRLVWRGSVTPTALTATYNLEVQYRLGSRPRVFVRDPPLRRREGKGAPHRFKDGSLCLHVYGEWAAEMNIARTVLLWAFEWLVHYELWLVTGEWHGGGVHGPQPKLEPADEPTHGSPGE